MYLLDWSDDEALRRTIWTSQMWITQVDLLAHGS